MKDGPRPEPESLSPTAPLTPDQRIDLNRRWNQLAPMRHLGARADFQDPAAVRIEIDPVLEHHRGGMGTEAINGAVISGLCDAAVGMVGFLHTQGRRAGTAQLNVVFLRPLLGDRAIATGRLTRAGTNLIFAAVEVTDERGTVCARCEGIVAVSGKGGVGREAI
ncbi:MAG: PaaI family thioesterase [Gemmatimonadales bacterium]